MQPAAEKVSEHPLGRAIVEQPAARGLALPPARGVEVLTGFGVRAQTNGSEILVGNRALLDSRGIPISADAASANWPNLERAGLHGDPGGRGPAPGRPDLTGRRDPAGKRPSAFGPSKKLGIDKTVMISGDNAATVQTVAHQAGRGRVVWPGAARSEAGPDPQMQAQGLERGLRRRWRQRRAGPGRWPTWGSPWAWRAPTWPSKRPTWP